MTCEYNVLARLGYQPSVLADLARLGTVFHFLINCVNGLDQARYRDSLFCDVDTVVLSRRPAKVASVFAGIITERQSRVETLAEA